MNTYRQRFTEMVQQLDSHPKVKILSFVTFKGVSDQIIAKVEASLGQPIESAIKQFYKETNGLQIRWITTENEDFDPELHTPTTAILDWDYANENFRPEDGVVMILPLEMVFLRNLRDVVYFDWMQDKSVLHDGNSLNMLGFFKNIKPFDLYGYEDDMAFFTSGNGYLRVLHGEDNFGSYSRSRGTTFADYLEFLLANKGLVSSRKAFYSTEEGQPIKMLETPSHFWSKENSFDLFGYLLKKIFPQAGQQGADTSKLNPSLMHQLAASSSPLTADEIKTILRQHHVFLESGGGGGHWETLSVANLVMGFYRGPKATAGEQASFERKHLAKALSFEDAIMPYASFCGCYSPGVSFAGANLSNCLFTDAVLENALFTAAKLRGSDFSRAILRQADFREADLRSCDFENCDLRGADFRGAMLEGSRFPGALLEDVKY
ncbi:MAG: pentapeptide repeat-containing protein [Bacteroidota bacterium]